MPTTTPCCEDMAPRFETESGRHVLTRGRSRLQLLQRHWRVRHDVVDTAGIATLRWAGKLRHLAIGRTHTSTRVIILVAGPNTLVVNPATGEIIAEHHLDPNRDYQPKRK